MPPVCECGQKVGEALEHDIEVLEEKLGRKARLNLMPMQDGDVANTEADVADTLNRLAPGLEALAPTIDALHEAVITLSQVVNPLSNIAGRIPLPRQRSRRSSRAPSCQGLATPANDAVTRPEPGSQTVAMRSKRQVRVSPPSLREIRSSASQTITSKAPRSASAIIC